MMIRGLRRGKPRTKGRGKLRTKVVAGVLAITLVVLAVFDFAAVTALRKYLIGQTDVTLKSALTVTRPRLTELLPAFNQKQAGVTVDLPVVGQYYIGWVSAKGNVVNLQVTPGLMLPPAVARQYNVTAAAQAAADAMAGKGQAAVGAAAGAGAGKPQTVIFGKPQTVITAIHAIPQFRAVSMAVPAQSGTEPPSPPQAGSYMRRWAAGSAAGWKPTCAAGPPVRRRLEAYMRRWAAGPPQAEALLAPPGRRPAASVSFQSSGLAGRNSLVLKMRQRSPGRATCQHQGHLVARPLEIRHPNPVHAAGQPRRSAPASPPDESHRCRSTAGRRYTASSHRRR